MVVVFIMGLLATLIVVNVAPATDQSRIGKAHSDIAALESALDMYNLDMYGYPSADQGLAALSTAPTGAQAAQYRPGGYIKRMRTDPWGNEYEYAFLAHGRAAPMTSSPLVRMDKPERTTISGTGIPQADDANPVLSIRHVFG